MTLCKLFISDGIKGKHCKQKSASVLNASMSPEWLKHLCICTYIEIAHSWNMQLYIESAMLLYIQGKKYQIHFLELTISNSLQLCLLLFTLLKSLHFLKSQGFLHSLWASLSLMEQPTHLWEHLSSIISPVCHFQLVSGYY